MMEFDAGYVNMSTFQFLFNQSNLRLTQPTKTETFGIPQQDFLPRLLSLKQYCSTSTISCLLAELN